MDADELTDEIMDCGCTQSHNDMANEFLMALVSSLSAIWPKAGGGEFSLLVKDSKGEPVVEFGGTVPRMPEGDEPSCCHN
jgi:hypothetical protein